MQHAYICVYVVVGCAITTTLAAGKVLLNPSELSGEKNENRDFCKLYLFLSGFLLCQSGGGLKAQETLLKLQCAQSYYEVDALRKSVFTGNISTKEFDHLYVDHHHYPNRDNSDWEDLVSISDTDIRFGTIVNLPNGRFGLIEKWVIDRSAGTLLNGAMMPMGSCHKVDGRNLQNKF